MALYMQDPSDPKTVYLIEALLDSCQDAVSGGGAFGFASSYGAELLLKDKTFEKFAKKHPFTLIVGVDAITNLKCVQCLKQLEKGLKNLKVRAFLHNQNNRIFHPKFCWFRKNDGGAVVAGSGNLTQGGLQGNWEAFTVTELTRVEAKTREQLWDRWIEAHKDHLKAIDDAEVVKRVKLNKRKRKAAARKGGASDSEEQGAAVPKPKPDGDVLVAEIPRAGGPVGRWKQANFSLECFEHFFGASTTQQRRIFLYHVSTDGAIPPQAECRPSVTVKSRNFRFELDAASGLAYPSNPQTRPIGVFVRVATRTFRYRLLMPGQPGYSEVASFLHSHCQHQVRACCRYETTVAELGQAWPNSPLWAATT